MVFRVESLAEPIPGYQLLERLGGGGFGEVWKARAPGGILKAVKFLKGTPDDTPSAEKAMEQELRALHRIKDIRHPFILSLERYEVVDGQLVIVMELADCSLWDRFRECRNQGLPGIPRAELLRHLAEAAEALDLLNIEYQLQHLDVKPQNLFLVRNHVKVGDFGLVTDIEGVRSRLTSGATPYYASPETFEGTASRFSDQYSLAVVYQELLTGFRPFNGNSMLKLCLQHMKDAPNVAPLPPGDQDIVARALSKKPEERFPTCGELIHALREGGAAQAPMNEVARATRAGQLTDTPHVRNTPNGGGTSGVSAAPAAWAVRQRASTDNPEGVLLPAVIIGVGQVGRTVLQEFRRTLQERHGSGALLPHLRVLYIDTEPEAATRARKEDATLSEGEILLTPLNKPGHYLKTIRGRPRTEQWLNPQLLCRLPRNQVTTEGLRALGRLAFTEHYQGIRQRLQGELRACNQADALTAGKRQTRLEVRRSQPRVYVVAGLAGGTGSGMFIELAYLARQLLGQMGHDPSEVAGLLFLPPADRRSKDKLASVNTLAALTELNHFSSGGAFTAYYDEALDGVNDAAPPFGRCFLLPLPDESEGPGAFRENAATAGEFLCQELLSPVGRTLDALRLTRAEKRAGDSGAGPAARFQSFGSYRFYLPRREIRRELARGFARSLVYRWLNIDQAAVGDSIRTWLSQQWTELDLTPELLKLRLQEACAKALGQAAETIFDSVVNRLASNPSSLDASTLLAGIQKLEQVVGKPDQGLPANLTEDVEETAQALVGEGEQKLARMVAGVLADPKYRVAGAQEAIEQLTRTLGDLIRQQETRCQELRNQAQEIHTHIHSLLCNLQRSSLWIFRSKSKACGEVVEQLRLYPRTRLQGLLEERVLAICRVLHGLLPQYLQEITFCRNRLTEFAQLVESRAILPKATSSQYAGRAMLPLGCATVEEFVSLVLKDVTPTQLLEVDRRLEAAIQRQSKSLIDTCLGEDNSFRELQTLMLQEAQHFMTTQLGLANVAEMYLEQNGPDHGGLGIISAAFDEAVPELAGPLAPAESEIRILAMPNDTWGQRFGQLARKALPEVDWVDVRAGDEILFYREQEAIVLADLPQVGPAAQEAYRRMMTGDQFTPHCRTDIFDWLPVTAPP